jgi:sigma-B regulation protein RsbU (phosphoserine phosphatase)
MAETEQLLDIFLGDQLRQILERFSGIIPFPLVVMNTEGKLIAASSFPDSRDVESLRFHVDNVQHIITELGDGSEYPSRRIVAAPIYVQSEVVGYVAVRKGQFLDDEDEYISRVQLVASFIGDRAYAEYELKDLTEKLLERYSEITLIYEISEALSAVLDPATVCRVIIDQVVGVVGVEKASIMLYNEKSNYLYIAASYGLELTEEERRQIRVTPGEGVSGQVFATGDHILIENTEDTMFPDLPHSDRGYKKKSFLSVPMKKEYKKKSFLSVPIVFNPVKTEKKVMGVINMTDKKSSDMFTSVDLRLLTAIASQAAMSLYNIQLIEEVKDAERVKREMEIAQQIQMGLLPSKPPEFPGLDLAGRCRPATQVGGDYYDFFLNSDNKLGVVIADVSGHDVGSAFIMATARSTLRSEVLARKSPAKILEDTNFVLYDDLTRAEKFITMFYAEYDATARILSYSNGGHNHPIVLRDGKCTFLDTEGMTIGVLDSFDFEEKTMHLEPNDFVIFYTDGVVEAKNKEGQMFTIERLCNVIETADWQCYAGELLDRIYAEIEQYSRNTLRSDDITVIVLKIY